MPHLPEGLPTLRRLANALRLVMGYHDFRFALGSTQVRVRIPAVLPSARYLGRHHTGYLSRPWTCDIHPRDSSFDEPDATCVRHPPAHVRDDGHTPLCGRSALFITSANRIVKRNIGECKFICE